MKFKVGEICLGHYEKVEWREVEVIGLDPQPNYPYLIKDLVDSMIHPAQDEYLKKLPPKDEPCEWEDLKDIWIPCTEETLEAELSGIPEVGHD